ncbi:hypothetical protein BGZ70_004032 [Mortierella alpina]|uniref:Uncharacterized protein n=1 Tax=Mortierella alpina TaxID=64518 RepID=A0A9P6IUJ9_MORAP|nr:hypothetical protein BGZ70_004032 [Mortierella alpina]
MSRLIPRIDIHQTSRHAVLVLHAEDIDPNSISTVLSATKDSCQITYLDQPTRSKVEVRIRPQSLQPSADPQGLSGALIQDCTCSPSHENIVIKFAKFQATEWQALKLTFKSVPTQMSAAEVKAETETEIEAEGGIDINGMHIDQNEASVTLKFVTEANVGQLHDAIRDSRLWESEHDQHVGNVQAKRVPGVNAIHMTAELVSNVSSSSS